MPIGAALALASDAVELGVSIAKLIGNAHKVKTEKAELASLKQPLYQIQNEFFQNKNIAEAEAGGGLPQTVKDTLDKQRRTGLGTSISAMLQSGALPGDISKLFDIYDQSISTDAARDSEVHRQNIQMYMDAAKDLAGQKTTAWAVNEYQPYKEKLNQLTQNLATSKTNVSSAIQSIIGSLGAAGTSLSNSDLLRSDKKERDLGVGAHTAPLPGISDNTLPHLSTTSSDLVHSGSNAENQTYSLDQIMQMLNQLKK